MTRRRNDKDPCLVSSFSYHLSERDILLEFHRLLDERHLTQSDALWWFIDQCVKTKGEALKEVERNR